MIGCTPFAEHASVNGHRGIEAVAVGERRRPGKPSFAARFAIALGSIAPSSIVKEEKTRNGTYGWVTNRLWRR